MEKYYNEVCDDAQQALIAAMAKLNKARIHLDNRGFNLAADKAAVIINDIKAAANAIDGLPGFDDDQE